MTYSGVLNAPPTTFPDPAVTTLDTTGVIREKPYLYWDEQADDWAVLVPELRDGTRGTTWENGSTPGESIRSTISTSPPPTTPSGRSTPRSTSASTSCSPPASTGSPTRSR